MNIKKCPLCGADAMKRVTGEFKARSGGRELSIPSVPRQKCSSCGEEYFDREANTILDQYRKTTEKNVKAAA